METTFYILSDPQVGHERQESRMRIKRDVLLKCATKHEVLIVPGDLTQHGIGNMSNPLIKVFMYVSVCETDEGGECR